MRLSGKGPGDYQSDSLQVRACECRGEVKIGDYFDDGRRAWLRFHEKGGKRHEVPVHHNALGYMGSWQQRAVIPISE
jgi:hypothetical protein